MRAIVYTQYGAPDVLHVQKIAKPEPKDTEILIKIHAVNVNYGDLIARNFKNISAGEFNMPAIMWFPAKAAFGLSKPRNPILGSEFSGEVEAIGNKVKRFKVGDAVFGYRGMSMGAYAEYLCMSEKGSVTLKPTNMDFDHAATIPYGGLMALNLVKKAAIKQGHKVLVNGASGAMGSYALQLAKYYGAEVTGVCGTPRVKYVHSLGANKVIDYTKEDFTQLQDSYDIIIDILGRSSFSDCKNVLNERGLYLLASYKMKQVFQMLGTSFSSGKKVVCAMLSDSADDLNQVRNLVSEGHITTIIDKQFSMEQAEKAHRYVEDGHKQGQVIITMNA